MSIQLYSFLGLCRSSTAGEGVQQTPPMLDVAATQNHQQLSQLLAAGNVTRLPGNVELAGVATQSSYGVVASRNLGGVTSAVPTANIAAAAARGATLPGIVTTLGQVSNNIVTLSRQGNITLVPAGSQGMSTVIGGHRVAGPTPHQQHLVAINTGVGNAGPTLLAVSSSNATMARLQPMSSGAAAVMSLPTGMVINVSQSQPPGLAVSANGNHIGPTLVMARGVTPQQFGSTVQQHGVMDGLAGNVGLSNPAQMAMPTVPAQQMGARVGEFITLYHIITQFMLQNIT